MREQYLLQCHLNMHLDHGLPYECGAEERPEWNEEVTTGDTSQVKQGVWDTGGFYNDGIIPIHIYLSSTRDAILNHQNSKINNASKYVDSYM